MIISVPVFPQYEELNTAEQSGTPQKCKTIHFRNQQRKNTERVPTLRKSTLVLIRGPIRI